MVSFGERLPGQDVPTMRSFASVPAALSPVVVALDELRRQLRAHPSRVLRGRAAWQIGEVSRGEEATLGLMLTNVGNSPLDLSNPIASRGGWSGMRLVFGRAGATGEQQRDLPAADLRPAEGTPRTPMLTLAPGQSIRFDARMKADLPSGKYSVRVEYHSLTNPDDDAQFVGGVLSLDAGPVTVKRGAWWRLP
jgi:hypothetical protein